MGRKIISILILIILTIVLFSGCNQLNPETNKFIGTWYRENNQYLMMDLYSDGTGSLNAMSTTWEIKDGRFVVKLADGLATAGCGYSFNEDGTILSLDTIDTSLKGNWIKQ